MPIRAQDDFVRGLVLVMQAEDVKMKPLSLAAGMSESGVRDLLRYGSSPRTEHAVALAHALDRTVDDIVAIGRAGTVLPKTGRATVAVAGRVGGGAKVALVDDFAKGDGLYHVERPPVLPNHGIVAVEVVGDSMAPHYPEGSVLFFRRDSHGVPVEDFGRICVCEDDEGHVWVKHVKVGAAEGTFSLISTNDTAPHRHGVHLRWAARVLFQLPPDYVRRVD